MRETWGGEVVEMTHGLKGHMFFTSYAFGTELLQKIRMVVTVQKNNPEFSSALTNPRGRACFS